MSINALMQATASSESYFGLTGISFRGTTIETRERLTLAGERRERFLTLLGEHPLLQESVIVTTCNRTEVVTASNLGYAADVRSYVLDIWEHVSEVRRKEFHQGVYHFEDAEVIRHVFRVASGLDSMVLGEPQVLGQLKQAFEHAVNTGTANLLLNRLFQQAFSVAKRVRTETEISRYPVSIAYAARILCEHIFGSLQETTALIIGAGDTSTLVLKHLLAAGVTNVRVLSRTVEHAQECGERFGVAWGGLDGLTEALCSADIVVSACGIPPGQAHLITEEMASASASKRFGSLQLFIDLGVPRNIDERVGEFSDAFLYNIDDLQAVVQANASQRKSAATEAEQLVHAETERFIAWMGTRFVRESIRDARQRIRHFEQQELQKTLKRLQRNGLSAEQCAMVSAAVLDYSDAVLAKVLHRPFSRLWERGTADIHYLEDFRQNFLDGELRAEDRSRGRRRGNE